MEWQPGTAPGRVLTCSPHRFATAGNGSGGRSSSSHLPVGSASVSGRSDARRRACGACSHEGHRPQPWFVLLGSHQYDATSLTTPLGRAREEHIGSYRSMRGVNKKNFHVRALTRSSGDAAYTCWRLLARHFGRKRAHVAARKFRDILPAVFAGRGKRSCHPRLYLRELACQQRARESSHLQERRPASAGQALSTVHRPVVNHNALYKQVVARRRKGCVR